MVTFRRGTLGPDVTSMLLSCAIRAIDGRCRRVVTDVCGSVSESSDEKLARRVRALFALDAAIIADGGVGAIGFEGAGLGAIEFAIAAEAFSSDASFFTFE